MRGSPFRRAFAGVSHMDGTSYPKEMNEYPNFNERALGCKRFSDLLKLLEKDGVCRVELDEQKTMLVRIL